MIGAEGVAPAVVREEAGCLVVQGALTPQELLKLSKRVPRGAVMDMHAARLLGVSFVLGLPAATEALGKAHEPGARARTERSYGSLPEDAVEWLAVGERGSSSEALFFHLLLPRKSGSKAHPYDVADLRRCLLVAEQVQLVRDRLHRARGLSPIWEGLVEGWPALVEALSAEVPDWRERRAPLARARRCAQLLSAILKADVAVASGGA